MPLVRPLAVFAALATLPMLVAACNDDGRTLDPAPTVPISQATTTTIGPTTPEVGGNADSAVIEPAIIDPAAITLSSPAFADGGLIDSTFTCDGLDVPPPLTIAGVPDGVAELAIVVTDRDADGYVHWVLAGLAPDTRTLEPGLIPTGTVSALTDSGVDGWEGPCPPADDAAHTYDFVVHAMREPIGLAAGLTGRDAIALIEDASDASDLFVATYLRESA